MSRKISTGLLLTMCMLFTIQAQGVGTAGENTDLWKVRPGGIWSADSIWMGATFMRDTAKPFKVWLDANDAGHTGSLFLEVPGGAVGGGDTSIFLFTNHSAIGTTVNLTNNPVVRAFIGHMDTIFFKYVDTDHAVAQQPIGYSGPNRRAGDGFVGTDRYSSPDRTANTFVDPTGVTRTIGRRYCTAGWIRNQTLNSRTDTVEFAFEDHHQPQGSDYDFNDIVFHVTGVFLIRPTTITEIRLDAMPVADTIRAGDTVSYTATVMVDSTDINGVVHHIADTIRSQNVRWQIIGDTTGGKMVFPSPNRKNKFTATKAFKTYQIVATIVDQASGQAVQKSLSVYVIPNIPYRLHIEGVAATAANFDRNNANNVTSVSLGTTDTAYNSLYAIARDRFGNFNYTVTNATWNSLQTAIVTARSGTASLGQGIVSKAGTSGTAQVVASKPDSSSLRFKDTVNVVVDPASYTDLRFVVGTGGQKRVITALEIQLTRDTILYAEGHRADNRFGDANDGWVKINVAWALSPNLRANFPAPASDTTWLFRPITDTGHGTITITYGTLPVKTLQVAVIPGGPNRLDIYTKRSAPGPGNDPYFGPSVLPYQWEAGRPMPLVAKMFDPYGLWLSQYQSAPLNTSISWKAFDVTNGNQVDATFGSFSTITGDSVSFIPRKAYDTLDLVAEFSSTPLLFRDTVRIIVRPGAIKYLTIEADSAVLPQYANRENALTQITMSNTLSQVYAYGILRDAYYNFVQFADSTQWRSIDTTVATAVNGIARVGQGLMTRKTSSEDTTWVFAQRGSLTDSLMVIVSAVTYDSLRMYVLENGRRYISTMSIRTDEDTTVYVEGKRSDNGQWVGVPVTWTAPGLTLNPAPPATTTPSYDNFQPTMVSTGRIIATRQGTTGLIRDTIAVTVTPGLPTSLSLYRKEGTPAPANPANTPCPDQTTPDTVTAGSPLTLVAKLFDRNNVWLSSYERATAPISWRVVEMAGNNLTPTGSLIPVAGHKAVYTPLRAYNTVDIHAEYSENGLVFSDIIRVYVKPDTAASLVIEGSPAPAGIGRNQSEKITTVTFTKSDTIKYAYAVLRDRFGNFTGTSPATDWISREAAIAAARENNPANGEGAIIRIGKNGQTMVRATARGKPLLTDTITVVLQSITYDSLRIIVGDSTRINTLVMSTDGDTTIQVQGRRSDNGRWESVPGSWWITSGFRTTPAAPSLSESWSFTPSDTGSGLIIVNMTSSVSDTITFRFTHGVAASMALYPTTGQPTAPYPPPVEAIIDTAGRPVAVVAKIFDARGVWLQDYERVSAPISWDTVELAGNNPPTGGLSIDTGSSTVFTPVRSYNSVYVIASFNENGLRFKDTILIRVVSGPARHVVIESDQNPPRNRANPIDTVRIPDNSTFRSVYAILRDSLWNLVDYSTATAWESFDTATVRASNGNTVVGEGILRRGSIADTAIITARSTRYTGLIDSATVVVLAYHFIQLRIVARPGDTTEITSVNISTNDYDSLYVIGLRSDTALWVPVSARWGNSPALQISPSAPENAPSWIFSPDTAGNGWIRVTMVNDSVTISDSIPVTFTRGRPLSAEFELLTPPEGRVAGDTLLAIVRIRNADGLVPGIYRYSADSAAIYRDVFGGTPGFTPTVITSEDTGTLGSGVDQYFNEGVDTIKLVLYYAPLNRDSTHNVTIALKGGISASTGPFILLPAAIDRLVILDKDGKDIGTQVTLDYKTTPSTVLRSRSYDRFGNDRGYESADWSTSGSIPSITKPRNTSRVFYDISNVSDNGSGFIIVVAVDTSMGRKLDTVAITFTGPPISMTSAVTQDLDGDGYLDAVVIHFDRAITLPNSYKDSIAITYVKTWVNDSLRGRDSTFDSVFVLYLHEDARILSDTSRPQTGLIPYISLNLPGVGTLAPKTPTVDGAPPVIWKVEKQIMNPDDRSQDVVTVYFSEKILGTGGQPIEPGISAASLFNVYSSSTGELIPDSTMFKGITVTEVTGDTIIKFRMTNGADLSSLNFLNIDTASGITDKARSNKVVVPENRPVRVKIIGKVSEIARPVPNPTRPYFGTVPPGTFKAVNEPQAPKWAVQHGGSAIKFSLLIPTDDDGQSSLSTKVSMYLKVYDIVGNMVNSSSTKDFIGDSKNLPRDSSVVPVYIYWNGSNKNGMPVAPGTYRIVIYIQYSDPQYPATRVFTNIGITR